MLGIVRLLFVYGYRPNVHRTRTCLRCGLPAARQQQQQLPQIAGNDKLITLYAFFRRAVIRRRRSRGAYASDKRAIAVTLHGVGFVVLRYRRVPSPRRVHRWRIAQVGICSIAANRIRITY